MLEVAQFSNAIRVLKAGVPRFAPDFSDKFLFSIWFDSLKDLSYSDLISAVKWFCLNADLFPSIREIRRRALGISANPNHDAEIISASIEATVRNVGYANPRLAEDRLGPMAWEVVRQLGGWNVVCAIESESEMSSRRRQWRELARVISESAQTKDLDLKPTLPSGTKFSPKLSEAVMAAINAPQKVS